MLCASQASADETRLNEMLTTQACDWGSAPDPACSGEMPRRVQHLVDIMLRRVQIPKEPDEPLEVLTRRDFRHFALRKLGAPENHIPDSWTKEKQPGETREK